MPSENLHNEEVLIKAMQQGDKEAFTALYHYYSPRLYTNILYMVRDPVAAEEMVQELFTRVWQKREYKGIRENFGGYLYQTARNLVHDYFRHLRKDQKLLAKFRMLVLDIDNSTETLFDRKESSFLLHHAIEMLPPQQKKVFRLVKVYGYTYQKTAEILGISAFTVKEYLVAAKKTIRKYIVSHPGTSFRLVAWLIGVAILF